MLAVELTSLGSPISAATGRRHNHCTSGGAPLELWYWVSSSLCETSFCRVIQVQIDLLFGLNLHTTSEMKYFFFKNILFSAHKHPRASLVCSVPSPLKKRN